MIVSDFVVPDTIIGYSGRDNLYGDNANNEEEATDPGDDVITTNGGDDYVEAGLGNDTVDGVREDQTYKMYVDNTTARKLKFTYYCDGDKEGTFTVPGTTSKWKEWSLVCERSLVSVKMQAKIVLNWNKVAGSDQQKEF